MDHTCHPMAAARGGERAIFRALLVGNQVGRQIAESIPAEQALVELLGFGSEAAGGGPICFLKAGIEDEVLSGKY